MNLKEYNNDNLGDPKATITFLGRNITSKFGIQLFKFMSIIVPLLPTFALVLYNGIQLESLITRSNLLAESFEQVSRIQNYYHFNVRNYNQSFMCFMNNSIFKNRCKMPYHYQYWHQLFKMRDTAWYSNLYLHPKGKD